MALQFFNEFFELPDIRHGQRTVRRKVCYKGRDLALEQPVQQCLAFGLHIIRAADQRVIEITAISPCSCKGLFAKQAGYQSAHRSRAPVIGLCGCGDDFLRRQGALAPQGFHDLALRSGNQDFLSHDSIMIRTYSRVKIQAYYAFGLQALSRFVLRLALGQVMQHQRRRLVGIAGFQRRQDFQMVVNRAVYLLHGILPLPDQEIP
jgi:hypothetical protein